MTSTSDASPSSLAPLSSAPEAPLCFSRRRAALQLLEHVVTSSQHRSHFFLHVNGRSHTTHVFVGKFSFFTPRIPPLSVFERFPRAAETQRPAPRSETRPAGNPKRASVERGDEATATRERRAELARRDARALANNMCRVARHVALFATQQPIRMFAECGFGHMCRIGARTKA